jgi:hypothetical protein
VGSKTIVGKCIGCNIGSAVYKRYSPLALEILRKELANMDMEKIWEKNRPKYKSRSKMKHQC